MTPLSDNNQANVINESFKGFGWERNADPSNFYPNSARL